MSERTVDMDKLIHRNSVKDTSCREGASSGQERMVHWRSIDKACLWREIGHINRV
jgi:hypothetical protein